LDRNKNLTEEQLNHLILELLFEWELQLTIQVKAVEEWGVPMRQPELEEMEYRRRYTDQAAQVIPEWAKEHAQSTYGGFYVDNRAGGNIYVGFTENQHNLVESLKQSASLINPGSIFEFPTPPTTSIASLEATEASVTEALVGSPSALESMSSLTVSPEGGTVQVGATNTGLVSEFINSHFGAGAHISVYFESKDILAVGRYASSGPVVGGAGLTNGKGICTAGFGARAETGQARGVPQYSYFALTAGHCFAHDDAVGRENDRFSFSGSSIGKVRRGPYPPGEKNVTDAEGVLVNNALRTHSVLNGTPLEAQPIQGVERVPDGNYVCWSGVISGNHCGMVHGQHVSNLDGHTRFLFEADGLAATGDSGGPVWDPKTHKAVGLITTVRPGGGKGCSLLSHEAELCPRMRFTPLDLPQGSYPAGIQNWLGVEVLGQG
jgi:hypothetical protein